MTKNNIIEKIKEDKNRLLLENNNIKHLYLVGSFSRGDENENSDVDFIYETGIGGIKSGFEFIKMKLELEKKIGKEVDLVDEKYINKNLRDYIEKDKLLIF